ENNEAERIWGLVTELDGLSKKILLANLLCKPLEKFGISLFKKEIMSVSNRFSEVLEKILVEHEEILEEDQGTDMMDVLLAVCRDENAEHMISRSHIKSLFVAPTPQRKQYSGQWQRSLTTLIFLRHLEKISNKLLIQETDIPNLPYLQAAVKEGLRLHPPLPVFVRTVQKRCMMGGFYIPENTTLAVNAYAVMRDPDSWENPNEFRPERFLTSSRSGQEDERREQALKYISFGNGRRGCPGSRLGYVFVRTAVGMMVQCFDWRIKDDKVHMEEDGGLNLSMAHPLRCTPVARIQPLLANLRP
ncbi:unnamed protein product, partial [Thlaspi arvense]